jgi:hypothetical protein
LSALVQHCKLAIPLHPSSTASAACLQEENLDFSRTMASGFTTAFTAAALL